MAKKEDKWYRAQGYNWRIQQYWDAKGIVKQKQNGQEVDIFLFFQYDFDCIALMHTPSLPIIDKLRVCLFLIKQTEPNDPQPNKRTSSKHCLRTYSLSISSSSSFVDIIAYYNNDKMRKLNLTFPDQINQELSLFLLNRPKICKKQTRRGWSSNDRIINVRNNYLEYYNLHPGFSQEDPNSLKIKYFKGAVRLDLIHQVNYLPKNKIKKNYLQIVFPEKKKINHAKDQSKTAEIEDQDEQKGEKQQILEKWTFEFPFDLIEYIEQKREQAKQQQRLLAKIAQVSLAQMISPQQFKNINSEQNILTPKSKVNSVHNDYEIDIQKYVQTIQKTKNILKTKAEMAQEQRNRQQKKKEKELAQMKNIQDQDVQQTFSISSFWRDYFKYYQLIMKGDNNKLQKNEKINKEIDLLRQIQYFNSHAKKIVQDYIDQLVCGFDQTTKQFQGFHYYQGLWLKIGGKQLNQQFMVYYNINDVLFSLKEVKGFKFRLPLMSLFDCKGFKILVMCDMPFSELQKTEVYNLSLQEGDMLLAGKLKECLDIIEDILNVKSQPFQLQSKKKVMAPLGPHLKIYQYHFKKDKTQDQITLPNFYYLINIGMIFPINYNFQKDGPDYLARLRPQIIAFFRDYCKDENTQLLSQAFMDSTLPQQTKRGEDRKAIQASKLIESYWIPLLIQKLNNGELMFTDSYSIKSIMQQMGINIRYLYRICEKVSLPYVRELVIVQALARTIKKQFKQALSDLSYEANLFQKKENNQNSKDKARYINTKKLQFIAKYKSFAIDYLNLVFGEGEQTIQFWKIILNKCSKYYKISAEFPPLVRPGCLLNAVLWHCGLSINFNDKVPLFKSNTPFYQQNQVQFQTRMKTFDFPSFQIQKLYRSAPTLQDNVNFQLFKQSNPKLLKMELLFGKTIGNNWTFNTTLAKLNNYQEYLQKPNLRNDFHPILIPYYISNKSAYNFKCGINILNFSLPQTHPLLISFYLEYSSIIDPDLIKKTALLLSVKCFGQFHPKTTELYSKYYHEGDQQYRIKAQRMKDIAACQIICRQYFNDCRYESCLGYCIDQVNKMKERNGSQRLGTGNYHLYIEMLMQGLQSAVKIQQYQKGIFLSKTLSQVVSSFKFRDRTFTEALYRHTLAIHLLKSPKKYFLYKMALFVIHIRTSHQVVNYDKDKLMLACTGQQKNKIIDGLASQYYEHGNHSNWIAFILATIMKSFQYFNFLEDLFNNYAFHLKRYNSDQFKACIGYYDLLVCLFGQQLFKQALYDGNFN